MKKLKSLNDEQLFNIVAESNELRVLFDDYINDLFSYDMDDKLRLLKPDNYSVGLYSPSFIRVNNYEKFVYNLLDYSNCFGLSSACENLLTRCENLRGTNLFEYWAKQLVENVYKNEIKADIDYYENISYSVYNAEYTDEVRDLFNMFVECGQLDEYYINNENQVCKIQLVK